MEIVKGGVIYYLDRNAYNVNNPELLVIKMDIIEKVPSTFEEGGLYAYAKQGYYTIQFPVSKEKVAELTKSERPYLFATREEALEQYKKENSKAVNAVLNMPKEELVSKLFYAWDNQSDAFGDINIRNAMKEKIEKEFGVKID